MVTRIDVAYEIGPTTDRFTVTHSVHGIGIIVLTSGVYRSLDLLCAEMQTQLQGLAATLRCAVAGERVVIWDVAPAIFSVAWTHPALRDWLGWSGNLAGGTTYTAPSLCPGRWTGVLPWDSQRPLGWEWSLRRWRRGPDGGSVRIGRATLWHAIFQVPASEFAALRSVLSLLLQHRPGRWWRDAAVLAPWSWSQWWGYVDIRLSPQMQSYADQWARQDLLSVMAIELDLVEDL